MLSVESVNFSIICSKSVRHGKIKALKLLLEELTRGTMRLGHRTAPIPQQKTSTSTINERLGSRCPYMGAEVNLDLRLLQTLEQQEAIGVFLAHLVDGS